MDNMPRIYGARQTILVTCRGRLNLFGKEIERDDIITMDWHMPTSFEPFLYAISVGKKRTSYKLIKESRCFVVNFIPYELKDKALFCGRHSGMSIDKFAKSGLTKFPAVHVECFVIKEAIGWLECHVVQEIDTGDHVVFVGEVAYQKLKEDLPRLFHTEGDSFTTTK